MKPYIFWTFISILTVAFYHLILKQFQVLGYNNTLALIWLHVIMLIFLCISYYKNQGNITEVFTKVITDKKFLLMALVAGFFSYITHDFGYYSFLQYRNPGYFEALINAEALVVLVLSIFLFNSHFGLQELFGALLIISGTIILAYKESTA
jgi:drug/metabolite transporter (DMT)-like permease